MFVDGKMNKPQSSSKQTLQHDTSEFYHFTMILYTYKMKINLQ